MCIGLYLPWTLVFGVLLLTHVIDVSVVVTTNNYLFLCILLHVFDYYVISHVVQ